MNTPSILSLVVASICALGLSACSEEDSEPVTWRVLETGAYSNIEDATRKVIQSESEWHDWWQRHNTAMEVIDGEEQIPAPPEVDFSQETILIATLGMRSSGGYSIEFADIQRSADRVVAVVKMSSPGPDDMVTMALTAPYSIVAIPKHEGAVEFRD